MRIAKIIGLTVVASSFIIGTFILASSYLQARVSDLALLLICARSNNVARIIVYFSEFMRSNANIGFNFREGTNAGNIASKCTLGGRKKNARRLFSIRFFLFYC